MNERAKRIASIDPALLRRVPAQANGLLIIDVGAIAKNYNALNVVSRAAECAGVIKANGYGLGAEAIAPVLHSAGCVTFFTATLDEAAKIRKILPSVVIYTLNGLSPGTAQYYPALNVRPVLNSLQEVREWSALASKHGKRFPAALQLDTGMGRLGLPHGELSLLVDDRDLLNSFALVLVMSHLACADEPDNPKNIKQKDTFDRMRTMLPPVKASLANSAGTMLGQQFHYDLVRPGIALYGARAIGERDNPMQNVVTLYGRVLQIREAWTGETIGYGASETIRRPSRLATIAVGYADGYPRHLSSSNEHYGGLVSVDGTLCSILGRVSMDSVIVDITDVEPGRIGHGDWIEMIGPTVPVDDVAERCGTIGYEVLTRLGQRFERLYIGDQNHG